MNMYIESSIDIRFLLCIIYDLISIGSLLESFTAMSSGHLLSAPQRLLGPVGPAQLPGGSLPTQPPGAPTTTAPTAAAAAAAAPNPPPAPGGGYGRHDIHGVGRCRAVQAT